MLSWNIEKLNLELKYDWAISRNTSTSKTNFIIRISDGKLTGAGETAPNIRYGETPEGIENEFGILSEKLPVGTISLRQFDEFLINLKISSALRFGIESAYVEFLAKSEDKTIYSFLGLEKPKPVETSFSIPIMSPSNLKGFWETNNLSRFKRLKVKVELNSALDTINVISKFTNQPLLIDANESWTDPDLFLDFASELKSFNILFIEQPLPSNLVTEYQYLKKISNYEIFADESVTEKSDLNELVSQFHGVNVKLMKAGGYLNAISQLKKARALRLKTMIGCMVETTIGINSAYQISTLADYVDLDGFLLLKNEPFGIIKEENGELSV